VPRRKADPAIQEILALLEQTDDEISEATTEIIRAKISELEPSGIMDSKLPTVVGRRHSRSIKAYEVAVNKREMDRLGMCRESADRWSRLEMEVLSLVAAHLEASDKESSKPVK